MSLGPRRPAGASRGGWRSSSLAMTPMPGAAAVPGPRHRRPSDPGRPPNPRASGELGDRGDRTSHRDRLRCWDRSVEIPRGFRRMAKLPVRPLTASIGRRRERQGAREPVRTQEIAGGRHRHLAPVRQRGRFPPRAEVDRDRAGQYTRGIAVGSERRDVGGLGQRLGGELSRRRVRFLLQGEARPGDDGALVGTRTPR
jgi:hypothetical protein